MYNLTYVLAPRPRGHRPRLAKRYCANPDCLRLLNAWQDRYCALCRKRRLDTIKKYSRIPNTRD
jgi:hypothetical protein